MRNKPRRARVGNYRSISICKRLHLAKIHWKLWLTKDLTQSVYFFLCLVTYFLFNLQTIVSVGNTFIASASASGRRHKWFYAFKLL